MDGRTRPERCKRTPRMALKKVLEFFDSDILQLFEFARFLFDQGLHVIGKRSSRKSQQVAPKPHRSFF